MLGMARALMLEPKVVLLDEPTAGLSPAYTDVVWGQIRRGGQRMSDATPEFSPETRTRQASAASPGPGSCTPGR
jgi:alpha-D-ribose 1-methylphosphonate 5-triphosphate synthase subunit PhnL